MFGLNVPPAPEYGATVTLETNYRLSDGEYIRKMKWYKDDVVFMSYAEGPKRFLNWSPLPGVNIDVRTGRLRERERRALSEIRCGGVRAIS